MTTPAEMSLPELLEEAAKHYDIAWDNKAGDAPKFAAALRAHAERLKGGPGLREAVLSAACPTCGTSAGSKCIPAAFGSPDGGMFCCRRLEAAEKGR
jgi:hypothetical protein